MLQACFKFTVVIGYINANIRKYLDKYLLLIIENNITVCIDDDSNRLLQCFSHMFVYLYSFQYPKKRAFWNCSKFSVAFRTDISFKVNILYMLWKTNSYLRVCSLQYMIH